MFGVVEEFPAHTPNTTNEQEKSSTLIVKRTKQLFHVEQKKIVGVGQLLFIVQMVFPKKDQNMWIASIRN